MKLNAWLRPVQALIFSVAAFATSVAFADAPGRVARLAEYSGEVQVANASEPWQAAYRNLVVTAGDNLWVSENGRAELDVGPIQVWLAGGSNVYFEQFDDHSMVARIASGVVAVRIRRWESKDAMRIATPHGEVSFVQPGLYIVAAGDQYAPSSVTTRFGQAELNADGRFQWVSAGDTYSFDRNGARFDRFVYSGNAWGAFESWVTARDRRIDRWEQRHRGDYANPWVIGIRDLDDHGYWDTSYEYGRVWYPRSVSYDWAPYRYGRWSWVQPWGWTWVDDAPWGFAPFHYGRWVRVGSRWAWAPGSYVGRAVYAPALVTFFGGRNWSVSLSTGPTYAWVPLGWNEPYVPWYTYSTNYWRQVNRPYVRNSAEDPWRPPAYIHARVPGAVTAIAAAQLTAGRPVAQYAIRNIPDPDLRSAPPARMGEVVPQFAGRRGFDPNPVANPVVREGAAPVIRSGPPPAIVKERAPAAVQPNVNVVEPRVWQDPNPIVRSQVRESAPRAVVREGARESAPGYSQRSAPTNDRVQVSPGRAPISESAPSAPIVRERKERAPVRIQESQSSESQNFTQRNRREVNSSSGDGPPRERIIRESREQREERREAVQERKIERAVERQNERINDAPQRANDTPQRGKDRVPAPREN
jgi:hypothetical protein